MLRAGRLREWLGGLPERTDRFVAMDLDLHGELEVEEMDGGFEVEESDGGFEVEEVEEMVESASPRDQEYGGRMAPDREDPLSPGLAARIKRAEERGRIQAETAAARLEMELRREEECRRRRDEYR